MAYSEVTDDNKAYVRIFEQSSKEDLERRVNRFLDKDYNQDYYLDDVKFNHVSVSRGTNTRYVAILKKE